MDPNRKAEKAEKVAAKKAAYEEEVAGLTFVEWPKIARLNRDVVITEKLDGTNAAIGIVEMTGHPEGWAPPPNEGCVKVNNVWYRVYAQSRSRIITPSDDNYGFAMWVRRHAASLVELIGAGLHFGEWWGVGINRQYDLSERRFSLFNTAKWEDDPAGKAALATARERDCAIYTVPVLYAGPWVSDFEVRCEELGKGGIPITETFAPDVMLEILKHKGSVAAPGFMDPEGIVVFHKASGQCFKATTENDAGHKGA